MFKVAEISKEMTYDLRHQILRPHQDFAMVKYDTDSYAGSFHVGAFADDRLVCIVSFCLEQCDKFRVEKQYRLRAMATLPEYRRMGAGKAVVSYAEKLLMRQGFSFIWCKARTSASAYYQKLGFIEKGEPFDYPGIGEHIIMWKSL